MEPDAIQDKLYVLSKSKFRSSFHLGKKEREMVEEKGMNMIKQHAAEIITKRLAPSHPLHDGRQTPYKGHPVFVAQHATGTCCRGCLRYWHKIEKRQDLTQEEQWYIIAVIETWIKNELMLHQ
jgi:predicted Fe-S protein YdhL (DUF1289 family)